MSCIKSLTNELMIKIPNGSIELRDGILLQRFI